MNKLPVEILTLIFSSYNLQQIKELIAISRVCKYFRDIILSHTRKIAINFRNERKEEIDKASEELGYFIGLKAVKVELSFDENLTEKANFCNKNSLKITQLILREISFLNPILNDNNHAYDNLISLHIYKCDLASCSQNLADFIVSCRNLKHLTISFCDGLDGESLNSIGTQLHKTQIDNFELFPTYSYYDTSQLHDDADFWRIDKLKAFSVRSSMKEIVVMKRNFVRIMLGRKICDNLRKLELIAELNYGDNNNFVPFLITHFPNLETLLLGRGISSMKNQDFVNICNGLKKLNALEFHFVHQGEVALTHLQRNQTITELKLGLTRDISIDDLKTIASRLPNLKKVSIIHYNIQRNHHEYLNKLTKIFPIVQFQKTGQKFNQTLLLSTNNDNIVCVS